MQGGLKRRSARAGPKGRRSSRAAARGAAILSALLLMPSLLLAAEEPQWKRALLTLVVNDVPKGEVLAILRLPDVFVAVRSLEEEAGLHGFAGRREDIDGRPWVSLRSLAPDVQFVLDDRSLTLRLTAAARLLGTRSVRLRPGAPRGMEVSRATSGFVNYALNWTERIGYDAATELGLHVGGALALTTASWQQGRDPVRGQTSFVFDDRGRLRRLTFGDTYARASLLGFSGYLIGIRVARDYSLDPYYVQFPTGALSTEVLTPSTAEVYVNGQLISREVIQPGQFRVADLPLVSGSNVARMVIRDAFGRTNEVSAPYYVTTSALAQGLHDYDYAIGYPRRRFGLASFDYGRPAFFGQHRRGLTESLTAGFRAEFDVRQVAAGPMVNLRLRQGQIEASALASRRAGRSGFALGLGYTFVSRPFSVGLTARGASDGFSAIGQASDRQPSLEVNAFAGTQFAGRISLTLQHAYADRRGLGVSQRLALVGSARLFNAASAFVTVSRDRDRGSRDVSFTTGLTMPLGGRTTGSIHVDGLRGRVSAVAEAQRPLPVGSGVGYRARVGASGDLPGRTVSGTLQAQAGFGRYEVGQDVLGGLTSTRVAIAGGVVGIGGSLFATRPVESSFALVRVPGAPGVRTYSNNHEIGRTNRRGETLVPNLLPYYGNRLGISDQDVPLDFAVNETERTVAPPYRGGTVVTFRAAQVQPVTGKVVLVKGAAKIVPSFGEVRLTLDGGEQVSPIGGGGEFYFENVPPGRHNAVVEYRGVTCIAAFVMPASLDAFVRLGTVRCVAREP